MTGFKVFPSINMVNGKIEESDFVWYKRSKQPLNSDHSDNWIKIHKGFIYEVQPDDLDCYLKVICLPRFKSKVGISREIYSPRVVIQGPINCPFENDFHYIKSLVMEIEEFRLVSYNLLANAYADSDYSRDVLYSYCNNLYLHYEYRQNLIIKQLCGYESDIYFLQEIDTDFYRKALHPVFSLQNYRTFYSSKPKISEGLCILINRAKFDIIQQEVNIYSDLLENFDQLDWLKNEIQNQNAKLWQRLINLQNIFQIMILRSKSTQSKRILIEKFSGYKISSIISGDFNSTPEFSVVKFLQTKQVGPNDEDLLSNAEESLANVSFKHNLNLKSACGFPNYTNYAENFFGCLDYIFYDFDSLEVIQTVPMIDHKEVIREKALPNEKIPSDHLPLICTLAWR
ncbi:2',5'-phosphodiesterase 12-like protein [Sarcoptes scabiei]|uniref:2',5'-phosphodiesterase 12-like protein n=1 Tax=Sarcoptes scabiei TaxID=52283 RepID=A0A132AM12_SARSC|nr:2',5'-phosphodiesterase 12-like protein [Sarcoptes scabiei]